MIHTETPICHKTSMPKKCASPYNGFSPRKSLRKSSTRSFTAWIVQIRSNFWSVFSRIRTEYGDLRIWSEYRKIRTRNNSVFGHFSRSDCLNKFFSPTTCTLFLSWYLFFKVGIFQSFSWTVSLNKWFAAVCRIPTYSVLNFAFHFFSSHTKFFFIEESSQYLNFI